MKNRKVISAVTALVILACMSLESYGQDKRVRYVADRVVAVVGSTMILDSELLMTQEYIKMQQLQQGYSSPNIRGEALELLLTQKLLATQAAIDSLDINDAAIEQATSERINELIQMRGGRRELEQYYKKPLYSITDIVRDKMRENEMANAMQRKVSSDVSITPKEVAKMYATFDKDSLPVVPEQYSFAKIAKLPSDSEESKLDVREQLLDLRSRILDGASFSALARMYSDDIASARRGGEMNPQPANVFVTQFKDAVETLRIGELSSVIETEFGYHILEVMEKKDDLYKVRHILLRVKFTAEDKEQAIIAMDSVYNQLQSDSLTFEQAVELYSDDITSKTNKGVAINDIYQRYGARFKSTYFKREELDKLYTTISELKVGEISAPFAYTSPSLDESVLIIKLLEVIPSHTANIKDDYPIIEEITLNQLRSEEYKRWLNRKIEEMYIKIEEPYRDIKLSNPNWNK